MQQSTAQVPIITADTLADQTNNTAASIGGAVEGLYDTVASEDSATEEAVYSVLVDSGTASTASGNAKQK